MRQSKRVTLTCASKTAPHSNGLGEISPEGIGAIQRQRNGAGAGPPRLESTPRAESGPSFNSYPGKNTPEHKDYIMDKLVEE